MGVGSWFGFVFRNFDFELELELVVLALSCSFFFLRLASCLLALGYWDCDVGVAGGNKPQFQFKVILQTGSDPCAFVHVNVPLFIFKSQVAGGLAVAGAVAVCWSCSCDLQLLYILGLCLCLVLVR